MKFSAMQRQQMLQHIGDEPQTLHIAFSALLCIKLNPTLARFCLQFTMITPRLLGCHLL